MEKRIKNLKSHAERLGREAKEIGVEAKEIAMEAKEIATKKIHNLSKRTTAAGTAVRDSAQLAFRAAQDAAVAGAKVTDHVIRDNPYSALGIAFGIGTVFGFWGGLRKRNSTTSENSGI